MTPDDIRRFVSFGFLGRRRSIRRGSTAAKHVDLHVCRAISSRISPLARSDRLLIVGRESSLHIDLDGQSALDLFLPRETLLINGSHRHFFQKFAATTASPIHLHCQSISSMNCSSEQIDRCPLARPWLLCSFLRLPSCRVPGLLLIGHDASAIDRVKLKEGPPDIDFDTDEKLLPLSALLSAHGAEWQIDLVLMSFSSSSTPLTPF